MASGIVILLALLVESLDAMRIFSVCCTGSGHEFKNSVVSVKTGGNAHSPTDASAGSKCAVQPGQSLELKTCS